MVQHSKINILFSSSHFILFHLCMERWMGLYLQ